MKLAILDLLGYYDWYTINIHITQLYLEGE